MSHKRSRSASSHGTETAKYSNWIQPDQLAKGFAFVMLSFGEGGMKMFPSCGSSTVDRQLKTFQRKTTMAFAAVFGEVWSSQVQ